MKVHTVLDQIDLGSIALPEFQRGYVWNRDQVRALMDSLYRGHPVGGLLVWETNSDEAQTRGSGTTSSSGTTQLLLDGQQRVTSLYGIIRGQAPRFFDGNERAFLELYFNIEEETFEFYAPTKMDGNPLWTNVTSLMKDGIGGLIAQISSAEGGQEKSAAYFERINRIAMIKDREFHIDVVTGKDKTVDVVVDIFNRVNSGGTKLSKGDLALARTCVEWPNARQRMREILEKYRRHGFYFKLDWLLRCVNTVVTGEALFSALEGIRPDEFKSGLIRAEKYIDYMINLIASRLGLDHDRVLASRYAFAIVANLLERSGGSLSDPRTVNKLLYWYIHSILWGRYSGSTESSINQDLALIEDTDGAIDRLIEQLRQGRGDLTIVPNDFVGWSRGARFYPLLYMLTRVGHSVDWETGIELAQHMIGYASELHVHHIFPKSVLYAAGYERPQVNAVANFTFLTMGTNLQVSNKLPKDYLAAYQAKDPSLLASHWIPDDPKLWEIDNYEAFLEQRRILLSRAANDFLNELVEGRVAVPISDVSVLDREAVAIPGSVDSESEERLIKECNEWVVSKGLPEGEYMYELHNHRTGAALASLDLAWPEGLQSGLSDPVALLIDEDSETQSIVNREGYLYFTDVETLKTYVRSEILADDDSLSA